MAQNEETTEAVVAEENLTSYTSESGPAEAEAPKKERPALTVAGAAVGRRKEAVARVRVVPGSGKWTINGRELANYFPNKLHQQDVNEPFKILDLDGAYDVIRPHPRWWHLRPGRCPAPRHRPFTERDRHREQPRHPEEGRLPAP